MSVQSVQLPLQHVGFRPGTFPRLVFRDAGRQQMNSGSCGNRMFLWRGGVLSGSRVVAWVSTCGFQPVLLLGLGRVSADTCS